MRLARPKSPPPLRHGLNRPISIYCRHLLFGFTINFGAAIGVVMLPLGSVDCLQHSRYKHLSPTLSPFFLCFLRWLACFVFHCGDGGGGDQHQNRFIMSSWIVMVLTVSRRRILTFVGLFFKGAAIERFQHAVISLSRLFEEKPTKLLLANFLSSSWHSLACHPQRLHVMFIQPAIYPLSKRRDALCLCLLFNLCW